MKCPKCGVKCLWDPDNGEWLCPVCHECYELVVPPEKRIKTDWF